MKEILKLIQSNRKSVAREILPSNGKCDAPENIANYLVMPIQHKLWGQYHI